MSRYLDSRVFIPVAVKRIAVIVGCQPTIRWHSYLGDLDEKSLDLDVLNSTSNSTTVFDTKWVGNFHEWE